MLPNASELASKRVMVFFLLPFVWADRPSRLLSRRRRRLSHVQRLGLSEAQGRGR